MQNMNPEQSQLQVEDFLGDNTFQHYCAGTDQRCTHYWEKYLQANPGQEETIKEARRLYVILSGNKKPLNQQVDALKTGMNVPKVVSLVKRYTWIKVAAAILLVSSLSFLVYLNQQPQSSTLSYESVKQYTTLPGERKKVTLTDGTVILLNAKSSLSLDAGFNGRNRQVHLVGEAFFDVAHNKKKPFIVHTADFDINVLGTSFNVKAYPGESSETVLIKGLIRMEGKGSKRNSITLRPSQKVIFYRSTVPALAEKQIKSTNQHPEIAINQYTLLSDSSIAEMAWTQNRLEIVDQDFTEVKSMLERWYNVEITFKDRELEKYRFTATFTKENIEQVLNALQQAEHFKYEIKGNKVTISK